MTTPKNSVPGPPAVPNDLPPGFSGEIPLYHPKVTRKIDRFVGSAMTLLGILAVFIVLIVLLKNIAPGTSGERSATSRTIPATQDSDEPTTQGIVGD